MDYPLSMHNSLACQRDQKTQAQQPLTIEDVFEHSRKLGRTSIQLTTSGQAIYKTIVIPGSDRRSHSEQERHHPLPAL